MGVFRLPSWPLWVVSATLLLCADASASGEKNREAARPLFKKGNDCFDRKDYPCAITAFRQAYALFPSPKITLNIALTLEAMGDAPGAAEQFERFLKAADKEGDGKGALEQQRRTVDTKLTALREKLGSVTVKCEVSGAEVHLDGVSRDRTPTTRRIYAKPGKHRLELRKKGRGRWRREVELSAGAVVAVVVPRGALAPRVVKKAAPARATTDPTGRPIYKKWWFWTAIGVGVAAVAGGVTVGVLASQDAPAPELGAIRFD